MIHYNAYRGPRLSPARAAPPPPIVKLQVAPEPIATPPAPIPEEPVVAATRLMVADIQRAVCAEFNVTMDDIMSARRGAQIARPRQVAMYLSKLFTPLSLPQIGAKFGSRDHSTVIHACRRIEEICDKDAAFRAKVDATARRLNRFLDRERADDGAGPVAWAMGALA